MSLEVIIIFGIVYSDLIEFDRQRQYQITLSKFLGFHN